MFRKALHSYIFHLLGYQIIGRDSESRGKIILIIRTLSEVLTTKVKRSSFRLMEEKLRDE